MALVYLLVGGLMLGLAADIAWGGSSSGHAAGWSHRLVNRRIRVAGAALASLGVVPLLLRLASWQSLADEVASRARARGLHLMRDEACGLVLLALLVSGLTLTVLSRSVLGFAVGLVVGCVSVPLWYSSRCRARERALIDEMPEVFRTLAMALGSGETLTQAIEYVGLHERGYAGEAFVHAALRLRCGVSTEDAMRELGRELDAPGVGLLVTALAIAQRTGSPLRGLFQSSAQLVERQGEYERLLAVKTAQVRLSVRIVCLLPLALVCLLSLISVDYQQGIATLPGTASVLIATAMDCGALLIIRRLMRGVL